MQHQQQFLIDSCCQSSASTNERSVDGDILLESGCVLRIIGGQPLGLCCPEAAVSLGRDEAQSMEIIKAFSASSPPDRRRRLGSKQAGHITTPQSVQPASNSQPLQPPTPQITGDSACCSDGTPPTLPNCRLSADDFVPTVIANLPSSPRSAPHICSSTE